MIAQLSVISFDEIYPIWRTHLWPDRLSDITPNSAMCFLEGYDFFNMETTPTFFAITVNGEIAGINSGHMCKDLQYRSRGLFVFEKFRGKNFGRDLLLATIDQAREEGADMCWSYPRKTSWKSYIAAGFELASGWESSETNDANAYCKIDF
jgi:GNAT superfamily N-acetyltransferase